MSSATQGEITHTTVVRQKPQMTNPQILQMKIGLLGLQ